MVGDAQINLYIHRTARDRKKEKLNIHDDLFYWSKA